MTYGRGIRFVIFGVGAVGGVVAAQLHRAGQEVVAIARGAHLAAIRRSGLKMATPEAVHTVPLPVIASPDKMRFGDADVVLLAVKSQDTDVALRALSRVAPSTVA